MAKTKQVYDTQFAFYQQLLYFYKSGRQAIRREYTDLTRKYLDFNDKEKNSSAFLRRPQFEALEMYVFLKEFFGNRPLREIFTSWINNEDEFAANSSFVGTQGQGNFFNDLAREQAVFIKDEFEKYRFDYPNYIFALTMGLGKTILMAASIFYEFLLAKKYPADRRFCHNALVFAPDKTVLQSLKEIVTFDKGKVVPTDYVKVLDANIKVHFLDDSTDSTLNTLDNSDFNIIIANNQKIIVKRRRKEEGAAEKLFSFNPVSSGQASSRLSAIYGDVDISSADDLIINQRFQKLQRLRNIGIYVDEAHHVFGKALDKELFGTDRENSLRKTINMLVEAENRTESPVVACYNYTGTPYVNNRVLPDVAYSFGLAESIARGFLKDADVEGFHIVKDKDFLNGVINRFFNKHGRKTYEGLLPKLAIFAANIEEIKKTIRPWVEQILSDRKISLDTILVNVNDSALTKDEDIRYFNELDVPGSEGSKKQIIILCEKGREGWNCRSLFGVALFRNPASNVFVLQSTMRCLRQITDTQQKANVYLSEDNYKILDDELKKNFNIAISDIFNKGKKDKKRYEVRVLPPPRWLNIKEIQHHYEKKEKTTIDPINFCLADFDFTPYKATITIKNTMAKDREGQTISAEQYVEKREYGFLSLTAEISRYMNISCLKIQKILENSVEGADKVIKAINQYNAVLYDKIIPDIFHYLYEITVTTETNERKLLLLKDPPPDKGYYEFHADPELVVKESETTYNLVKGKSFHADTYCFDSNPEKECFNQYVFSDRVKEVFFTGMFTSHQGELAIQYIDPETHSLRNYYPDFVARMKDNTIQIIEVKGDNKLDDPVVKAKQAAAIELATESNNIEYLMLPGNFVLQTNIFDIPKNGEFTYSPTESGFGSQTAADYTKK
jgi:hypothetical protein